MKKILAVFAIGLLLAIAPQAMAAPIYLGVDAFEAGSNPGKQITFNVGDTDTLSNGDSSAFTINPVDISSGFDVSLVDFGMYAFERVETSEAGVFADRAFFFTNGTVPTINEANGGVFAGRAIGLNSEITVDTYGVVDLNSIGSQFWYYEKMNTISGVGQEGQYAGLISETGEIGQVNVGSGYMVGDTWTGTLWVADRLVYEGDIVDTFGPAQTFADVTLEYLALGGGTFNQDHLFSVSFDNVQALPPVPQPPVVPVPAAVWLLGTGLVALVGIRRRNNS